MYLITTQFRSIIDGQLLESTETAEDAFEFGSLVADYDEEDIVSAIRLNPDHTWVDVTDDAHAIIREDRQDAREWEAHCRSFAPSRATHGG